MTTRGRMYPGVKRRMAHRVRWHHPLGKLAIQEGPHRLLDIGVNRFAPSFPVHSSGLRIDIESRPQSLVHHILQQPDCVLRTALVGDPPAVDRSEEHTSELQSLMRISYAVFCLNTKKPRKNKQTTNNTNC